MLSRNKQTVEAYIEGFRHTDHQAILACLADDIEWSMPGYFQLQGKDAFDREIENDAFVGKPTITVHRMSEENDVVILEGAVQSQFRDGNRLNAVFCDVFEMRDGLIRRLVTYQVNL